MADVLIKRKDKILIPVQIKALSKRLSEFEIKI